MGLLPNGCEGGQHRLAVGTGGGSGSICIKLTSSYGITVPPLTAGGPLPLNRWVTVYAVQPSVPGKEPGSRIMDEDPAHWTRMSVYFSDRADLDASQLPPEASAVELLR